MAVILCLEPAPAMRAAGQARLTDSRVHWTESLTRRGPFRPHLVRRRHLAGQIHRAHDRFIGRLAYRPVERSVSISPPSTWVRPDEPGGGDDPWLLELPALLSDSSQRDEPATEPAGRSGRRFGNLVYAASMKPQ